MTAPDETGDTLVLDSRQLRRQPGASARQHVTIAAEGDLHNDVIGIPAGAPLDMELLLESVLDGILVTGTVVTPMTGNCVRCLDPIARDETLRFQQFFTYPGAEPPEQGESEDAVEMTGHLMDIRPAFRDAVVLALPLSPTCRPDCPGLCPECGFRFADDPDHGHVHEDPRWAALSKWQHGAPTKESD